MELLENAQLIKQGAEARVYKLADFYPIPTTRWPSKITKHLSPSQAQPHASTSTSSSAVPPAPLLLKHRFPKRYRHPTLDTQLTRTRLTSEARSLLRCLKAGICVPAVRMVDLDSGMLGLEWIEGWSVREVLGGGEEGEEVFEEVVADEGAQGMDNGEEGEEEGRTEAEMALENLGLSQEDLMIAIGKSLASMHMKDIIHGDLTTSNMMLRPKIGSVPNYEIVLIDFGLSSNSTLTENLAVDLYVLERAFASTHPASEALFQLVLGSYGKGLGEKKWKLVKARLDEVRLRGRKRDMTG